MFLPNKSKNIEDIPEFEGDFLNSGFEISKIGNGKVGGKAQGLINIKDIIASSADLDKFRERGITIGIPKMVVLTTEVFDKFMESNNLYDIAYSDMADSNIAMDFQKASFPAQYIGALRHIVTKSHTPLAVRSSSLLEDSMFEPFAGIYGTKMIPNNDHDTDTRFNKLIEAIKFVFSSTFFKEAKDYIAATESNIKEEKMAVIIQEVVGQKYGNKFYPEISGVGRSFNFYPFGHSKPEEGVINLAFGLGKTIVDGNASWMYCPGYPKTPAPAGSAKYLMEKSQNKFWSVNLQKPTDYDPTTETEFLLENDIYEAENDCSLAYIASTYDYESDRIIFDTSKPGPRIINFASILQFEYLPLNDIVKNVLAISEKTYETAVEIEFAITYNSRGKDIKFGFLQVRPMVISNENITITDEDINSPDTIISSKNCLGNGNLDNIKDVVFIKPECFTAQNTPEMVPEIEEINKKMYFDKKPYLLIGFGRWGSSDPWLGIPVNWGQIANAKVIVESMLPEMNVELSQGSHFFHNITSFSVMYFSLPFSENGNIKWELLKSAEVIEDKKFVKHIKLLKPLLIKADGKTGKGVIRL